MKTIENITLYKCDFCKKELKRKHAMLNHEIKCWSNPSNYKACTDGCKHLIQVEKTVMFEGYDGYYESKKVNVFKCEKLDKFMYPLKIEQKDIVDKYPTTFEDQQAMPKQCDDYEDIYNFL